VPQSVVELRLEGLPRVQVSDLTGSFSFTAVRPGSHRLTAITPGYVGSDHSDLDGVPAEVTVIAGRRSEVTIRLVRTGVLAGAVRDEAGRPAARVPVYVRSVAQQQSPDRDLTGWAETDSHGNYRLSNVPPGEYILTAGVVPWQWRAAVRRGTNEESRRFRYIADYLSPSGGPEDATPVQLRPGETKTGLNLAIRLVEVWRLEARIDGAPPDEVELRAEPVGRDVLLNKPTVSPDGHYVWEGMPPGRYVIRVHSRKPLGAYTGETMVEVKPGVPASVVVQVKSPTPR
jgi:hypothetical protein